MYRPTKHTTRWFKSALAIFVCVAAGGDCFGQSLEESLTTEYPQYASSIRNLFEGNPRYIEPTQDGTTEPPYAIRFGLSHSIGDGVGNPSGYTSLESFLPLWDEAAGGIVFLNPIAHLDNFGNTAANIGLGWRQLIDAGTPTVIGVSAWYDYRRSNVGAYDYNQVSLGLEYLTDWLEIRSNIYIPDIGTDRRPLPNRFGGNSLQLNRGEVALAGVDVEVGTVLPAVGRFQGRVAVGYYHYEDSDAPSVNGLRVRGELAANQNLATDVTVSKDSVFGTTVE